MYYILNYQLFIASEMKRGVLSVIILLMLGAGAAASPKWVYGVSWGASYSFAAADKATYITEDLMLAEINDVHGYSRVNGLLMCRFGIGCRYNEFTLGTGWQGLARNCRVFPVTVAWSHFRDPERNSGLHLDLEAGVGFPEAKSNDIFYSGNIGFGYRIPVGCGLKMDCGISLRTSYVHLYDLPDPDTHKPIPAENFRSSQTTVGALVFSIGLIF